MKIRRRHKVRHSYGCRCNNPACGGYVSGKVCEAIGRDLPHMTPAEFAMKFGVSTQAVYDHFMCRPRPAPNRRGGPVGPPALRRR